MNAVAPGGTEAPPRRVPRNLQAPAVPDPREAGWWGTVVAQTKASSFMGRYGTTSEQAAAILFLASDEASFVTAASCRWRAATTAEEISKGSRGPHDNRRDRITGERRCP